MLPELGNYCLILALCLAALQCIVYFTKLAAINIMRPLAIGQVCFVFLGFLALVNAFLSDDFSLTYVAANSNSSLPLYYKFTALWGAHEGSLLLWIMILCCWMLFVAIASRRWPQQFSNTVLTVLAFINLGFLWLIISASNPFLRIFNDMPLDGADLNPLLQDLGMILHPPILYMGYVGCSVAFALAIAALVSGKIDQTWAQVARPWVLTSWIFLTLGITLGSWWAYYELGWGGWWFWDPVENASFMPWLTATALLHCLVIAARNAQLLLVAIFLALITFALSLLGTFLVRSGSISSVHAFAADPQRGILILNFLIITVGGALLLYALRMTRLTMPAAPRLAINQNSGLILINNLLLLVATGTVLLGTLYPLIYDAIFQKQISVGYPYFNAVFVPIMLLMFTGMLFATIKSKKLLLLTICGSCLCTVLFLMLWFGTAKINSCIGLTLAIAIIIASLRSKNLAMALAHLGIAISIIGMSITPMYEIEKDLRLKLGDHVKISNYDVVFKNIYNTEGPNYLGFKGEFEIRNLDQSIATIYPEKRMYLAREQPMTETAILPGLFQDIYIALGQKLDAETWSTRIYYKPFVRWIWLGAIIMALGAAYALRKKHQTI